MSKRPLPFKVSISFEKLINQYKTRLVDEQNLIVQTHLNNILDHLGEYPDLVTGIDSFDRIEGLTEPIGLLLADLFPTALTNNEIKAVTVPFYQKSIYSSKRLQKILKDSGDYELEFGDLSDDQLYVLACNVIISGYYNKNVNYVKPLYFKIPDIQNKLKTYRVATNADFIEINKTEDSIEVTEEDIDELLRNFDNIDLWKEKFPLDSWELKGFLILNMIDVTFDETISELKTSLLEMNPEDTNSYFNFVSIFQKLFDSDNLSIGFTEYNSTDNCFLNANKTHLRSYILSEEPQKKCDSSLCGGAFNKIIEENKNFVLTDVNYYNKTSGGNSLGTSLLANDIKSCILAPIVHDGKLLGVFEVVSTIKKELNMTHSKKLDIVMPYLVTAVRKAKTEKENRVKAIIQNECTSIHPSVLWKFEEEAYQFLLQKPDNSKYQFKDISFDYVYPLYGQIDIKDSSTTRNNAIQGDFLEQLNWVKNILEEAMTVELLPFYEQMIFRTNTFISELETSYSTSSEETMLYFLKNEINPVMPHIQGLSNELNGKIDTYNTLINSDSGIIYKQRKNYEETVQTINQKMAALIDEKQVTAQQIYPHFFERFKTDGVEHNIYIGESLTNTKSFSKIYLNNLRLWQLMSMCEMENEFYNMQTDYSLQLDCASLVLVFSNSLSIRYRVDEKKFDVDGAYNARYEIIKKRIDKAHIKGTNERITQKGKLVIVYSQKKDGLEYRRYINYLQSKAYLADEIEDIELEELQGVVGLRALRVNIIYDTTPIGMTFDRLIKEFEN